MPLKLSYHGKTDQGLVRSSNEDNLLLAPEHNLFVVCDGMGGHSAGEVASRTAVGTIAATFGFESSELSDDPLLSLDSDLPAAADLLVKSIRLANRRIYNRGSVDSNLSGMGTTIAALAFDGKMASIAHVGDSRIYVYRDNKLVPLTEDHSWVAEVQAAGNISEEAASTLVNKNIITRALGIKDTVEVDIRVEEAQAGDLYMLCSDGLCGYATDAEIERAITERRGDPKKTVDNLIQMANERGGSDNVTVICVKVTELNGAKRYAAQPVETITFENLATGEREDEWLEILAERSRERLEAGEPPASEAAAEAQQAGSRGFMLATLLVLLALTVALYYFWGDLL